MTKKKDKLNIAYSHHFSRQREKEIKEACKSGKPISPVDKKILEVGCGSGAVLSSFLKEGVPPGNLYGIDIWPERIENAKKLHPNMCFVCKNADRLPYPDEFFDIIIQATVFTSILEPRVKKNVASEMVRVLKPDGLIIWHDFRFDNPFNPNVKGIRKREIIDLFPDCQFNFKLMNLNPFIARPLAGFSWSLCNALEKIPILRTHWLATIKKKS